jgi:DNA-binding SARP family transcriptional activator/tetratricopeptide (TPR) repeat protein/transcriptional regulator with XRE-family HTH domain
VDEQQTLSELLRNFRLSARLTQEALAERAAVSSRTVRDIERGAVNGPRSSTAAALADALRLSTVDRDRFLAVATAASWENRQPNEQGAPSPAARVPHQPRAEFPAHTARAPGSPSTTGPAVPPFRILGPVEVGLPGSPVPLPGARQKKLLAALLLDVGAAVPHERLVDTLWESPPLSARQQIHNSIASLRRILASAPGNCRITTTPAGYQLHVPAELIDVSLFAALVEESEHLERHDKWGEALGSLERALNLWRGPALAGLSGGSLDTAATHLDGLRVAAVERAMALRLRLNPVSSLVSDLKSLVAQHPYRETLRAQLIEALHHSGQQVEALAVYEEGRQLLAQEFGIDPGPALRHAHLRVLRSSPATEPDAAEAADPDSATTQLAGRTPAGPGRLQNYLPHSTKEFTGRHAEVSRLNDTALSSPSKALIISALDGMGGVGKTALAVHLAHELTEEYPDGQYFVELHGFSPGRNPLTPPQALEQLLRQVGTAVEGVPPDLAGRSALWRSLLAGRRALILLDNAVDVAQVRPLMPGATQSLVIVTSRRRLAALEGAVPLSLNVLPPDDAQQLFIKIAGEERTRDATAGVATVTELCGRLPLAIRIAAARFRDRPSWSIEHLVQQLQDQRSRARFLSAGDRDVMAVLQLSYRHLTAEQQRLFCLLSLHTGEDFDAYAAAALADLPVARAEQVLEALFDDNLLLQHAAGRYQFHDLVRDCSRLLLPVEIDENTRTAATHRLLDYYLSLASRWCRPLAKGPFRFAAETQHRLPHAQAETPAEAAQLLQAEYHNIVAAADYAYRHGWHAYAWQIPCAMQPLLAGMNYGERAYLLFEQALSAASAIERADGRSMALTGMASACREAGENHRARALFEQAIGISRAAGNSGHEVFQLAGLGVTLLNDGDLPGAQKVFASGYRTAHALGDRATAALLGNNLGVVTKDLGQYEDALACFTQSAEQGEGISTEDMAILTALNIGIVHQLRDNLEAATGQYEDCLRRSEAIGFDVGKAVALVGLATVDRSLGNFGRALEHGRDALAVTRRISLWEVQCDALNALGDVFVSTGETTRAEALFAQSEQLAIEHNLPRNAARAREGIAHVHFAQNDLTAARRHWEEALRLFPAGVADAENSRRHLAPYASSQARCQRCTVFARGRPSGPSSRKVGGRYGDLPS